jgi:signal peptidase II
MASPRTQRAVIFVAVFLGTLAADQGTKAWARTLPVEPSGCTTSELGAQRCRGVPQPVIAGFWDWELAANDGAAFSSLRGSRVLLSLLAVLAVGVLGVAAYRTRPEQRLRRIALAAVAGGALGNLIDRAREGAVTDFVRWHVHEHQWPVFNVADVALVIGIMLLLLESIADRRRPVTVPG